MDRSFLTNEQLVEASSDFVCIRLATYEDSKEAGFLKDVFVGRSGELENTVFCFLAPDGKTQLSRPGRGPHFAYRSPSDMASAMKKMAQQFPAAPTDAPPRLPQMKNFRLALNVAECDALPLVVCVGESRDRITSLNHKLSSLAFDSEIAGKFAFYSTVDSKELTAVSGDVPESGFVVIVPGKFGTDGEIRLSVDATVDASELESRLAEFVSEFKPRSKEHRSHVRDGKESGVDWETEIPVTDPMSNRAKEGKSKGRGDRKGRKGKGRDRGKRKGDR